MVWIGYQKILKTILNLFLKINYESLKANNKKFL